MNSSRKVKLLLTVCIFSFIYSGEIVLAKGKKNVIRKASVPSVKATPNLDSIMSKMRSSKHVNTNGDLIDKDILVDNIKDPKCVFYGNYSNGTGSVSQTVDIDTVIFNCR